MDNEINKKLDDFIENTKFNFENINLKIKELKKDADNTELKFALAQLNKSVLLYTKDIQFYRNTLFYKIPAFFAKIREKRKRKIIRRKVKKIEKVQDRYYKLTGKTFESGS